MGKLYKRKKDYNLFDFVGFFALIGALFVAMWKGITSFFKVIFKGISKLINFTANESKKYNSKNEIQGNNDVAEIIINLEAYYQLYYNIKYLHNKKTIITHNFDESIVENDVKNLIKYIYKDIINLKGDNEFYELFNDNYYYKLICGMSRIRELKKAPNYDNHINLIATEKIENNGYCEYDYLDSIMDISSGLYHVEAQYVMEILSSCQSISYILFINNIVNKIKEDSEFYNIIKKMYYEIDDIYMISEKTYDLYKEYYQQEYGSLNNISYYELIRYLITKIKFKYNSFNENISNINEYLDDLYKKYISEKNTDVLYLYLINNLFKLDVDELSINLDALKNIAIIEEKHNKSEELRLKQIKKERYISGDFSEERKVIEEKYNLNNITTGSQFELYLENVFKDLGYKVRHTGKAGDQGADLVLKYGDKIYVVQAKYYSSKLDNTPVQEIVGAIKYYNANQGVVVTNSSFTNGAEQLAKANNIILIDGTELKQLVDLVFENPNEDVLEKYNP